METVKIVSDKNKIGNSNSQNIGVGFSEADNRVIFKNKENEEVHVGNGGLVSPFVGKLVFFISAIGAGDATVTMIENALGVEVETSERTDTGQYDVVINGVNGEPVGGEGGLLVNFNAIFSGNSATRSVTVGLPAENTIRVTNNVTTVADSVIVSTPTNGIAAFVTVYFKTA